jgi:hypothetical protein
MNAETILANLDLSIPQCEEVLRLLKVETGFLDNDGHFDEFVNPRFAG